MEAIIENLMEYDPPDLSQDQSQNIGMSFLFSAKKLFENSVSEAEFQEWKQGKQST